MSDDGRNAAKTPTHIIIIVLSSAGSKSEIFHRKVDTRPQYEGSDPSEVFLLLTRIGQTRTKLYVCRPRKNVVSVCFRKCFSSTALAIRLQSYYYYFIIMARRYIIGTYFHLLLRVFSVVLNVVRIITNTHAYVYADQWSTRYHVRSLKTIDIEQPAGVPPLTHVRPPRRDRIIIITSIIARVILQIPE